MMILEHTPGHWGFAGNTPVPESVAAPISGIHPVRAPRLWFCKELR